MTTTHLDFEPLRMTEEKMEIEHLVKGPNAYRTISEVADELHVPQHVLRFWETRFPEVKPLKRGGGRRYYSPEDINVLRRITDLLYVQGYTIKGVKRILRDGNGVQDAGGAFTAQEVTDEHSAETLTQAVNVPDLGEGLPSPDGGIVSLQGQAHSDVSSIVDPDQDTIAAEPEPAEHLSQDSEEMPIGTDRSQVVPLNDIGTHVEARNASRHDCTERPARQDDWLSDKRAMRAALEDILSELDSLRALLPKE